MKIILDSRNPHATAFSSLEGGMDHVVRGVAGIGFSMGEGDAWKHKVTPAQNGLTAVASMLQERHPGVDLPKEGERVFERRGQLFNVLADLVGTWDSYRNGVAAAGVVLRRLGSAWDLLEATK